MPKEGRQSSGKTGPGKMKKDETEDIAVDVLLCAAAVEHRRLLYHSKCTVLTT